MPISLDNLLGLGEIGVTLVVIFALFVLIRVYMPDTGRRARTAMMAALFAGSVVYCTAFPVTLAPGVIAGPRGALLTLAALYGGPVAGGITFAAAEVHRALLGGSGVYAGLIGNALAAAVGAAGWAWVTGRQRSRRVTFPILLASAAGVTGTTLLAFLFIRPFPTALDLLRSTGPALALVQFASVLILGGLLRVEFDARERRRQLQFQQTALDAHALVARLTPAGTVVHVNDKLCARSGHDAETLTAAPRRFMGGDGAGEANTFDAIWKTIRAGRTWRGEIRNTDDAGGVYVLEATVMPFVAPNGRVEQVVFVATDVTDRVTTAQELVAAKRAAESASRSKSEFLANISHELRTPLNAIMGFSDILQQEVFGPLGHARYREYANDINDAARYLYSLISDILDISRIETGSITVTPEPVDIADIAQSCTRMVQQRAQRKTIRVADEIAAGTPRVHADGSHLKQILVNLLTNAVKYTDAGGAVRLTTERITPEAVTVAVRDNGRGIPPDKLEEIQQPFVQIDRVPGQGNSEGEGVGLGLFLVKKLADLNAADVAIDCTPGVGTAVRITLPRAHAGERAVPGNGAPAAADGGGAVSAAAQPGSPPP